jgi:hypothetical protein
MTIKFIVNSELRFCDRCLTKTIQQTIEELDVIYTYKRKRIYICKTCGHKSYKRGLRPSAESVF